MNQALNILKKRDFEKYEIVIPFASIIGKRKKQYLASELEKLHPCFSDEYAFDFSLRKICRKGFFSDVYVMSKFKLAEYEGKRAFSGSGFLIERDAADKNGFPFHHFFVDKKWRWIVWLSLWCVLVGLAGAVSGSLAGSRYYRSVSAESDLGPENNSSSKGIPGEDVAGELRERLLVESLLLIVEKSGGKILDFEWSLNGYSEKLNASLSGVFPEKLEELSDIVKKENKRESVLYKNGIPLISVSYNLNHSEYLPPDFQYSNFSQRNNSRELNLFKALREKIIEFGGDPLEEKFSPYQIDFLCCGESDGPLSNLFDSLSKLLISGGMSVVSISIKRTGKLSASGGEELRIILSVDKLPFSAFDLQLLSKKLALFTDSKKSSVISVSDNYFLENKQAEENVASEIGDFAFKLGEIKRSDDSIVIFYKSKEGKIQKMIKSKEKI